MLEFILGLITSIIPRRGVDEPAALYRWRLTAALLQLALWLVVVGHIAWAGDWLVTLGLEGFPQTKDIQAITSTLEGLSDRLDMAERRSKEALIKQYDQAILEDRRSECRNIMDKNQEALAYATQKLQEDLESYQKTAGVSYRLPDCNEL